MYRKALAICIGISAAMMATQALAIEMCPRIDRCTCIVDGGTLWLEGINNRLEGYDTSEEHNNICGGFVEIDLAREATRRFMDLINQNDGTLRPLGRADRYGRVLANSYVDGEDVSDILVREGLARYWPDGDEFWCNGAYLKPDGNRLKL